MKYAIVGASGFIGRHLLKRLKEQGHDVIGYDIHPCERTGVLPIDVCSDGIVIAPGTEVVVYLSQSPHYRSFPEQADNLFGVNVVGAARVAAAAKKSGARLFVYASTGNVYTDSFAPMNEQTPLRRDNAYALSKVMGEDVVGAIAGEMQTLTIRIFGAFGPGQENMLVPGLAGRIKKQQAITLQRHPANIEDEGGLIVSLIYINDLLSGLEALIGGMLSGTIRDNVINVGGPNGVSIREIGMGIGQALGIEPIFELAEATRPFDLIADVKRLCSLVDISFTSLSKALQETVNSYE